MESKQVVKAGEPEATYQLYETGSSSKEIYVDGIQGASFGGPVVKVNFFSRGPGETATPGGIEERELACRLVMGIDTFAAIVQLLNRIDGDIKKQLAEQAAVKKA